MSLKKVIMDDDASSFSDDESSTFEEEESRDEVQEIRKSSKKENFRVTSMRFAVTGILLLTAVAVTATTYHLLNQEEHGNFEIAVRTHHHLVHGMAEPKCAAIHSRN